MKIDIQFIQESEHRYPTYGDYFEKDGVMNFRVTDTGNFDKDFAVLMHELTEWYLCKKKGISNTSIDEFDINFENNNGVGEPGDCIDSPYRRQHAIADLIERIILVELGIYKNTAD